MMRRMQRKEMKTRMDAAALTLVLVHRVDCLWCWSPITRHLAALTL